MKKLFKYFSILVFLIIVCIWAINFYVLSFSKINYFYDVDWLDKKYIWLVFWASVLRNGTPSDILKDRLKVAYDAYIKQKIQKIIVSWDNSQTNYNEPLAMKNYLLKLWVDEDDIYLDHAWFDTYDTLYRAREIFWAKELVLFTQDFHLKRAMYISSKLWINSFWVETNLQRYVADDYNNFREVFARLKAFWDVDIFKTKPKFLWDKIEILTDEKIDNAKKGILEK